VLLDAKAGGGNGNLIYLPLDKLLERTPLKESEPSADSGPRAAQGVDPDTINVEGRGRTDR